MVKSGEVYPHYGEVQFDENGFAVGYSDRARMIAAPTKCGYGVL